MGLFTSRTSSQLPWKHLKSEQDLVELMDESTEKTVVIFKHSTRCSISAMALNSFQSDWNYSTDDVQPYLLDLLTYRPISNLIAEKFGIRHESPQLLIIKDNSCVYHASHHQIQARDIKKHL